MIKNKNFKTKRQEKSGKQKKFIFSTFNEGIDLLKKKNKETSVKFEEKLDVVVNTNINTKSDSIKAIVELSSSGDNKKTVGVVISSEDIIKQIENMENVVILDKDKIKNIVEKKEIPFDVCLCSMEGLKKLVPAARVLGPKGLMPTVPAGNLIKDEKQTQDVLQKLISGSQISIKNNKNGQVLLSLGRMSNDNKVLEESFDKVIKAIEGARPKDFKGKLIKTVYLNTTMGYVSCKISSI